MGDDDFEESTAVFSIGPLGLSIPPIEQHRHVLVRMDGTDVGKVIALSPTSAFSIGRRTGCDLVLKYDGVSRKHARIVFVNDHYVVEDLGSANGTTVRGRRIERHVLVDGDVLQFGPLVSVRYSVTDADEEDLMRHLYQASVRDPLTGAYNREYLDERLRNEVAFAARHSSETALLMFDLDHFKRVNDTFGHQAGDAVLKAVVENVTRNLGAEDVLARYGGEEFAVSVRGIGAEKATQLGERIRQANGTRILFDGQEIPITMSVGCAISSEMDAPSVEGLIGIADRRLYAAKTGGRNRVVSAG